MPVTKKKGAIFAIYADSPVASTSTAASMSTSTASSAARPAPAASPSKRTRRPLGAASSADVQRPLGAKPLALGKPALGKTALNQTAPGKPVSVLGSKAAALASKQAATPASSGVDSRTKQRQGVATGAGGAMSKRAHSPLDTPAKRTRGADADRENRDKENADAVIGPLDSPAARTRSKTARPAPARAEPPRRAARPVNDENADPFGPAPTHTAKRPPPGSGTKAALSRPRVRADGPLADVSEVYGASGIEPDGFRDAGVV
ncbi:hypothetical protein Q5752_002868 [Cryptotrichosporon argae]